MTKLPTIEAFNVRFEHLRTLSSSGIFSILSAWNHLRTRRDPVEWFHLIWIKNSIPKLAFCLWLAVLGRLGTKDRGFNSEINHICVLCNSQEEDYNHLFFKCTVSDIIWKRMQIIGGFCTPILDWKSLVEWVAHKWKGSSLEMDIRKVCLAGTVYQIWAERNSRIHHNQASNVPQLCEKIVRLIKLKLHTLKGIPDNAHNRRTQARWNLPLSIFN